jgi:uncharacterized membrane protein
MTHRLEAFLLAALVSCLLAAGQIFLKQALTAVAPRPLFALIIHAAGQVQFWGAVVCTATAAILWMKVLASSSLSWAYPLISISYAVVALVSVFFLEERISAVGWIGLFLIVIGVSLVAKG